MASHIATEEWQSFELRMRRRRAERLIVRAEAALQNGSLEDAGSAIEEARALCPSLPSIDELQTKIARASERKPAVRARVRRTLAIAAGLVMVVSSSAIGWRAMRTRPAALPEHPATLPSSAAATSAPPAAPAAQSPVPAAPTPAPASSIKVETEQVPPVVISGATDDGDTATPSALPPPARTESASATAPPPPPVAAVDPGPPVVGTSGPPAAQPRLDSPPPSADAGAIAALGKETSVPVAPPPVDRFARLRDMANPAPEPSPSVPERRADPAPTSGSPEPTTPPPKKEDDAALVRGILDRYAEAYTHLDADAAKAVWPSVNRAALSRAFNGLNEQRIAFNDCSVDVRSTQARATCSGSTTWEPKIGGGPRTDTRRWAFDLEKSGDAWIIRDARVQNR